MSEGNKSRTVAATQMNTESSRSHAVFSIVLTQTEFDPASQVRKREGRTVALTCACHTCYLSCIPCSIIPPIIALEECCVSGRPFVGTCC